MRMSNTIIYVEDVFDTCDLPTKRFPSMIQACKYVYSRPEMGSKDLLICVGSYSLDYPRLGENLGQYYKRMKKMFHEMCDQPGVR